MKGFNYVMVCFIIGIILLLLNELYGIFFMLFCILDAIVQGNCGIWKRLDKNNESNKPVQTDIQLSNAKS